MAKRTGQTKRGGTRRAKRPDIVVFSIVRDSNCAECGEELWKGSFLRMEEDQPLCLSCADLDHLVYLPRGDAALTRRASKHSTLRAVVVRFSRARKRYERQGILVEEPALDRAEQECLNDEEARALRRERAAERRAQQDTEHLQAFAARVRERFPRCPPNEEHVVAHRACQKYSGRVGRSSSAKQFAPEALDLAVVAHVRHNHTNYDELLATGIERFEARRIVAEQLDRVLASWTQACE